MGRRGLKCSAEAAEVCARQSSQVAVADQMRDQESAEKEAKVCGHDLWRGNLKLTFGKYAGQSYKWLLENDVGWVVWLMSQYMLTGEKAPELLWQKERLLEYARDFSMIMDPINKRVQAQQNKEKAPTPKPEKFDPEFIEDAELLSLVGELILYKTDFNT